MTSLGLYVHVPFCSQICHYCDFAKTANFDSEKGTLYFERLREDLESFLAISSHPSWTIPTIYFGGGTPSLFPKEIASLLKALKNYITPTTEITVEANPEHITASDLYTLKEARVNRVSLGIQTFSAKGLKTLTRHHTPEQAKRALDLTKEIIGNANVDLIYGWPGQKENDFIEDLKILQALDPHHVSAYNLTYEGQTVFHRRKTRGLIKAPDESFDEKLYLLAKSYLSAYTHIEVSNFHKPGFASQHNKRYWQNQAYLGIGVGAHSYLQLSSPFGLRFSIPAKIKAYLEASPRGESLESWVSSLHGVFDQRKAHDWLLEMLLTSLRTQFGAPLREIKDKTHLNFSPSPRIQNALKEGVLQEIKGHLILNENEWFRENSWVLEIYRCFN